MVKSSQKVGAFAVFWGLKSLRVGGYIKNYSRLIPEICAYLGIGESSLRKAVAYLIKKGFARKNNPRDLVLCSSKRVAQHYGVSTTRSHKIATSQVKNLKLEFRELAMRENFAKQRYTLRKKLENQFILQTKKGTISSQHLTPQARKKALIGFNLEKEMARNTQHFLKEVSELLTTPSSPNPFITLSHGGIARLFGKKYRGTGQYWLKKLKDQGMITETPHEVDLGYFPSATYFLYLSIGMSPAYQWRKGRLKRVFPSILSLVDRG